MSDLKVKPPSLEAHIEIEGREAFIGVYLATSRVDGLQINISVGKDSISLTEEDFAKVQEAINNFRIALHAVRGTQP